MTNVEFGVNLGCSESVTNGSEVGKNDCLCSYLCSKVCVCVRVRALIC